MDVDFMMSNLAVYGYPLMFVLMYIEGPIVTFISSFLASFGLFSIFIVWFLAFMGDFLSDLMHFYVGGRGFNYVDKRLKKEGVASRSISRIRKMMRENLFRALLLVKISPPPISSSGLFLAGTFKKKRKKVILYSAIMSFCIESCFVLSGFFIGSYFYNVVGYFKGAQYLVMFFVGSLVLFLVVRKFLGVVSEKVIEKG